MKTNKDGHFGKFGGRYVPEMLIPALEELEAAYFKAKQDKKFRRTFEFYLKHFVGRPSPLVFAGNLTRELGGARIYIKNEGLNHTGAHKITHCLGQALLAKRMGKKTLIAETGAGQHGVATATVAAKFGFKCRIYMGEKDIERQRPNVFWMERLGAEVIPVGFGNKTLKDAVNAAIKDWIENVEDSYYLLGSVVGPHPYPTMTRDFQSVVGREIKAQLQQRERCAPDYVIACVGGGSNAMGAFAAFIPDSKVRLIGVEAGGESNRPGHNAIRFKGGAVGVVEGYKSYFLQDADGQIQKTSSIAAGLDYPGIGPELAYLHDTGRVQFISASDKQAIRAFEMLAKTEGIIAALESAHAVAGAMRIAPRLSKQKVIVVNLSGRGDKDLFIVAKAFKDEKFKQFLKRELESNE
jgi:tryptophan synthase beta chain